MPARPSIRLSPPHDGSLRPLVEPPSVFATPCDALPSLDELEVRRIFPTICDLPSFDFQRRCTHVGSRLVFAVPLDRAMRREAPANGSGAHHPDADFGSAASVTSVLGWSCRPQHWLRTNRMAILPSDLRRTRPPKTPSRTFSTTTPRGVSSSSAFPRTEKCDPMMPSTPGRPSLPCGSERHLQPRRVDLQLLQPASATRESCPGFRRRIRLDPTFRAAAEERPGFDVSTQIRAPPPYGRHRLRISRHPISRSFAWKRRSLSRGRPAARCLPFRFGAFGG